MVKRQIGFVGMPFGAIPYVQNMQSVSAVVHQIVSQMPSEFECHVVAGTRGKDNTRELPGAHYYDIECLGDRFLYPVYSAVTERVRRRNRNILDREVYTPFFARRAAGILAEQGCEAVFLNQFPQWLGVFRKALPEARLVVWLHSLHNIEEEGGVANQLDEADGIVCVSEAVTLRLLELKPELTGRVTTVPNGIDELRFVADDSTEREEVLFYSGRLVPYKGIHLLVDAFGLLAEDHPDLKLKITANFEAEKQEGLQGSLRNLARALLGPPGLDRSRPMAQSIIGAEHQQQISMLNELDYGQELISRAAEFSDRVEFVGPFSMDELADAYRACSIFVHPAIWHEAFGMGVVEAMACGAPVVTTDCGGPPLLVAECQGGIVAETSAQGLAQQIERILSDEELGDQLSRDGARRSKEIFTWKESARKLAVLLNEFS